MGLFVVAVSLVENALNPMRCKILYSYYILSSAAISHYVKSSFKFTLDWAIWLGYILRCKDVPNWLVLSQRSSGSVQWQTILPLKRSFFPRCDWWKPAEQPHVHQSYYKTTTWLGTICNISRKEARRILIWIEVTRWRNTGQGSRDTCSASLLIRSTSKGWCSSHPLYHTLRNWNLDITITTEGWNLDSCLLLCTGMPWTPRNIYFKYCTSQRFDWQILSPLKLPCHAEA